MIASIRERWGDVTALVGLCAAVLTMFTMAFSAYSVARDVGEMLEQDVRWIEMDAEQFEAEVALIEEVRTAQGVMLGRLDGASGGAFLYQIGVRDGRATCEVGR